MPLQFSNVVRALTTLAAAATLLSACSDDYLARRDTITMWSGDAVAINKVTQTVDPWPPYSANQKIAYEGQKMQTAVERYRTNRVTTPRGIGTTGSYVPTSPDAANSGGGPAPVGPTVTQPAAPVK